MTCEPTQPRYFSPVSRGAEEVLADELREIGIVAVEVRRGGVAFGETMEDAYRACLWSRVASRVLVPLVSFEAEDAATLYEAVHAIDWTEHLGPERTLAVGVAGADCPVGPPHFVVLKTKDAIVDRIRSTEGRRPDVDKRDPDVRIHVHLRRSQVTVSLDLAGHGMHRRGRGTTPTAAPLKENLAAAVLRFAGWPAAADAPLFDPMCGSATLLVEAACMALQIAPGLSRRRFGAQGLRSHDRSLWNRLRDEALDLCREGAGRELRIAGSDASRAAVEAARDVVERAGLAGRIRIAACELRDAEPPWSEPGRVVTNPPYGARLGEAGELGPLYEQLGDILKRRFPGWSAWVLSGNPALSKRIGLRPTSRTILFNGPIECRLLEIPLSAVAPSGEHGPGWRRTGEETRGFARRLAANAKRLGRWAKRERLTAYRLYDSDIPQYNLAIDRYGDALRVEEYPRPRKLAVEDADRRLQDALRVVPEALGVAPADIVLRVRRRLAPGEQHERYGDRGRFHEVREGDLVFRVNLTDYLDTGLFLDDRGIRNWIRRHARELDFLNLFAYTCTASVAAAAGGARSTTSVDLSRTYLDWGRENFRRNELDGPRQRFVREDVLRAVRRTGAVRRYGLIFAGPPTWSRSKSMRDEFDIQRDHLRLIGEIGRRLTEDGSLLFSTNSKRFVLDRRLGDDWAVEEISREITPPDFANRPLVRAWRLRRRRRTVSRDP